MLEVLQHKDKHAKIMAKIREFAEVTDKIMRLLYTNLNIKM